MFRKILIPLDGSPAAEHALNYLGCLNAGEILLARVRAQAFADDDAMLAADLAYLNSARAKLGAVLTVNVECLAGQPAEAILALVSQKDCDLILMTSHGRSSYQRFFRGSVAEEVARRATCPVMIVGPHMSAPPLNQEVVSAVATGNYFTQGCL